MRRFRRRIGDVVTPCIESQPAHVGGSGEAVVFVHGSPGSGEEWSDLVERVGEHRRALAFDMPGFGRADKPETFEHTVGAHARHLADVADTFGLNHMHLVLHDFGGPWGLRFAAEQPDRVASLTLINAGGMPGYRWHLLARIWRRPGLGELAMRTVSRSTFGLALRAGNPVPIPQHHAETMYADFDDATRRAVLELHRSTERSDLDRVAHELEGRDLPVLVIWGETDPFITLAEAQRFRRIFPDARFVRIADSGHWPHLTTPEAVEDALVGWLGRQVPV